MTETARPTDDFSLELARWQDFPQATRVGPSIVQTTSFLGHTETWTVQTIRHPEMGEAVFVQRIAAEGSLQLVLPARVTETIARQRDQVTARNRRRGARQAIETRRAQGLPVGNPEALRKARKARARKGK